MSADMTSLKPFKTPFGLKVVLFGLVALGLVALRILYVEDSNRAWFQILIGSVLFLSFGLCGLFFTAIQFLTSARWSVVIRRVLGAMALTLPVAAVLFIPIYFFGLHHLYEWSHSEVVNAHPVLQWKSGYLNECFFGIRLAIYFFIWIATSTWLIRNSLKQDISGDPQISTKNFRVAALTLVLFALSVSFAGFDILMSLEPHWFSTIFGVYFFAGLFQAGLAIIYIVTWFAHRMGTLSAFVTRDHFHDIGRFLFGFSVFWAYIGFSQFMLIWYGDLPEETFVYRDRLSLGWEWIGLALLAIRFVIPFLVLMPYGAKRCYPVALAISGLVLFGHWLDLYWFSMPALRHFSDVEGMFPAAIRWQEVSIGVGYLALFCLVIGFVMERIRMVPIKDPRLEVSMHYYHHG
jgi:hypothetical protein